MERNWIWVAMLFLFVLEGALLPIVLPEVWGVSLHIQFVLVCVVLLGLLYHRYTALIYGVCFGMLHDIMYGQMLGVSAFTLGLTGYLTSVVFADKYVSMVRNLFVLALSNLLYETVALFFKFLFGILGADFSWGMFSRRMAFLICLNVLFAAIIYTPSKAFLQKLNLRYGSFHSN